MIVPTYFEVTRAATISSFSIYEYVYTLYTSRLKQAPDASMSVKLYARHNELSKELIKYWSYFR